MENGIEIEFTEDYATKVKGEKWVCEPDLASDLVRIHKVAKYVTSVSEEPKKTKPKPTK